MESSPLVSIITITKNRADLIHRCIESIHRQTYQNYEHIIVDGNSSDNTKEIVSSYNDPHIKYIKLPKSGASYQMKEGSQRAKGKYITFLDDDDEYCPEKIEKQVEVFETLSNEYGIVYCWMTYYDSKDLSHALYVHAPTYRGDVHVEAVTGPNISGTPTLMIRNEVFQEYGGTFSEDCGLEGSDWELVARICQKYKVENVPESLVKVYINHGHSRLTTEIKHNDIITFSKYFLSTFKNVYAEDFHRANWHIYDLVRNNLKIRNYREALHYYLLLLKTKPSFKQLIAPIKDLIV